MSSLNNFAAFIVLALIAKMANTAAIGCPGSVSEGAEQISGGYYYKCQAGVLQPAGCLDKSGNKVAIGNSFVDVNTQKTCVLTENGKLTISCTACVTNDGKVVQPGQSVDAQNVYLICASNGEGKDLVVQGCIVSGQRVAVGDAIIQGDQSLSCQRGSKNSASVVPKGCVRNNKQYEIGSMFDDDNAFFHCKKDGNKAVAEAIGCIHEGRHVYDLDIYQNGDNFYRCRAGDSSVSADLFGCVLKKDDGSIEAKSIACTWDSGSDPINYVNCCIKKGDTAKVTQLYCLYTYRGGRIQVNEGCYRKFDSVLAGCKRNADGSLIMNTWDVKNVSSAKALGLHDCQ